MHCAGNVHGARPSDFPLWYPPIVSSQIPLGYVRGHGYQVIREKVHSLRLIEIVSMYFDTSLRTSRVDLSELSSPWWLFVYYESIKRELKIRPIYECRCDERLKSNVEES
jgi:hypothetical protein